MRISLILMLLALPVACSGGGSLGAACDSAADCESALQCVREVCVAKCERASQCGDGFACRSDGMCVEARGVEGNACGSETDCRAGLACMLDQRDNDNDGTLQATCVEDQTGHAVGAECSNDHQCRNGTCALGRCVDLCASDRDCPLTTSCSTIPRVEAEGASFRGCLPERGLITWDIAVPAPAADVLVPVPSHARSLSLAMTVDDDSQLVGASFMTSPRGLEIYNRLKDYYWNPLRHRALPSLAVLQIPTSSAVKLEPGAYHLTLSSLRPNGTTGSATPRLKATVRVGEVTSLQLHFHFLDLSDHPCRDSFSGKALDASTARSPGSFRTEFLEQLRALFAEAGITLAAPTYDNVRGNPAFDNVTPENARALLALSTYATGVNVYLVRSLSPVGMLALGPTPGTAGLKGSTASGVIISVEPLCYRSWEQLARTTAHQIAHYMGLFPNRDASGHEDPIDDSTDDPDNLMFYSELGGLSLTPGQRAILLGSPALQ